MTVSHPVPLDKLEIVGYNTILEKGREARVVAPIFRTLTGDRVIFPPFNLAYDKVSGGTVGHSRELKDLHAKMEITLLAETIETKIDHNLWVDDQLTVHYDPWDLAAARLSALSVKWTNEARTALSKDHLPEAERLCRLAVTANEQYLDPLVLLGVIHKQRGEEQEIELMAEFMTICSKKLFMGSVNSESQTFRDYFAHKKAPTEKRFLKKA